jgi:hypothetical protein
MRKKTVGLYGNTVPLKTVPVFKLLGALDGTTFVYSEIAYVARRPRWRYAVQEFADKVKSNPVVCLGLAGCCWLLLDLLSQILSEPKTILSPLLLVESEFDANTRNDVIALTQNRIQVAFIDAPLTDLVSRMKDVEDAGTTLPLVFRKPPSEFDHFVPFQDIVAPVNAQLTSQVGREETVRLVDLLFSPTLPRWDPFFHNLDFRRSLGTRMVDSLLRMAVAGRNLPAFALVGSAASGKTTVAKRVAYDLAARGHVVFWFRRAFYPNVQGILSDFFRVLAKVVDKRKRIFFLSTTPWDSGRLACRASLRTPRRLG